jgi:hypothetical protein
MTESQTAVVMAEMTLAGLRVVHEVVR